MMLLKDFLNHRHFDSPGFGNVTQDTLYATPPAVELAPAAAIRWLRCHLPAPRPPYSDLADRPRVHRTGCDSFLRLLQDASAAPASEETGVWPLTPGLRRRMLSYIEGWRGERVTEDRLMLGANRQGSLPPIFCVFNSEYEFADLARAMGPQQPIYAVRSLYFDPGFNDEDLIQALALGYIKDLEQVHPDGPLFLLAHCQGCDIAIAMAQHLLRRGRHVPLLILTEWMMESVSYPGDVLLIYGNDSEYHPKFARLSPEPGRRRMFGQVSVVEYDGGHNVLLDRVTWLAGELAQRCAQALDRSRPFLPLAECAAELIVDQRAMRAPPGARMPVEISVKNIGKAPLGGELSSLRLGGSWMRDGAAAGAPFVDATPLPALAPGDVTVVKIFPSAPENEGIFEFALDLFEERGFSLTALGAARSSARVKVMRRATRLRKSLRSLFRWRRPVVA